MKIGTIIGAMTEHSELVKEFAARLANAKEYL
jgi:hypothetical protein